MGIWSLPGVRKPDLHSREINTFARDYSLDFRLSRLKFQCSISGVLNINHSNKSRQSGFKIALSSPKLNTGLIPIGYP